MERPKVGQKVYIPGNEPVDPWQRATVTAINTTEEAGVVVTAEIKLKLPNNEQVSFPLENVARLNSSSSPLKNDTRVIATCSSKTRGQRKTGFYSGVATVYESNLLESGTRECLVFFDCGNVEIVTRADMRLMYKTQSPVWKDVPPATIKFLQEYVESQAIWPMLELKLDQIISAQWDHNWLPSRVTSICGPLVEITNVVDDHVSKSVFRGSCQIRAVSAQVLEKHSSIRAAGTNQKYKPLQEYGQGGYLEELNHFQGKGSSINLLDPDLCVEFQGECSVETIPTPTHILDRADAYHVCSKRCLPQFEEVKVPLGTNLLAVPLYWGWKQISTELEATAMYVSPCGKKFQVGKDLVDYLQTSFSRLTVDNFSVDPHISPSIVFSPLKHSGALTGNSDLRSEEDYPLQFINIINRKKPPKLEFIRNCIARGCEVPISLTTCCDCTDMCLDATKCACRKQTITGSEEFKNLNADATGYNYGRLIKRVSSGIYECNERCQCHSSNSVKCHNRIVQNAGGKIQLQLFHTARKGWGVRSLHDIPMGTFISLFTGEIVDEEEADKRQSQTYVLSLDFIEENEKLNNVSLKDSIASGGGEVESQEPQQNAEEPERSEDGEGPPTGKRQQLFGSAKKYFLDATKKGNITRFINHGCNPNVFAQPVFTETQDARFPSVAIFSGKRIRAGVEILWNYNYKPEDISGKAFTCRCGSEYCQKIQSETKMALRSSKAVSKEPKRELVA